MKIQIEGAARLVSRVGWLWCAAAFVRCVWLWSAFAFAGCAVADGGDVLGPTDPPPLGCTPETCPGQAPWADCEPYTCESLRAECGRPGDGCGGEPLDCGSCPSGSSCEYSLDPVGSRCVPAAASRKPVSVSPCSVAGVECGPVVDATGHVMDCGSCPSGLVCGDWPGRCCGPRPEDDELCVDVSPNHRLYRWCYSEPIAGCVQVSDLIRGTTLGAWCCP